MDVLPFQAEPDPAPYSVGQMAGKRDDTLSSFTTQESLVAYFAQWFSRDWIVALIEAEKEVFVVRRECSLEETRQQFMKKCENTLMRALTQPAEAGQDGWTAA